MPITKASNPMAKYSIKLTQSPEEVERAQRFRGRMFRSGQIDRDALDTQAVHAIIREENGAIVCVFRMLTAQGEAIEKCYSAQFYNLENIKARGLKALEIGRFCIDPEYQDHDIVRLAWAEITNYVLENEIDILFGCSSFHGADAERHMDALSLLTEKHLAPKSTMPLVKKVGDVFCFSDSIAKRPFNRRAAQLSMPPLLRSYLLMGGWVSDHAVVDRDLDTVHVFTGVEVNKIPANRLKIFHSLATRA